MQADTSAPETSADSTGVRERGSAEPDRPGSLGAGSLPDTRTQDDAALVRAGLRPFPEVSFVESHAALARLVAAAAPTAPSAPPDTRTQDDAGNLLPLTDRLREVASRKWLVAPVKELLVEAADALARLVAAAAPPVPSDTRTQKSISLGSEATGAQPLGDDGAAFTADSRVSPDASHTRTQDDAETALRLRRFAADCDARAEKTQALTSLDWSARAKLLREAADAIDRLVAAAATANTERDDADLNRGHEAFCFRCGACQPECPVVPEDCCGVPERCDLAQPADTNETEAALEELAGELRASNAHRQSLETALRHARKGRDDAVAERDAAAEALREAREAVREGRRILAWIHPVYHTLPEDFDFEKCRACRRQRELFDAALGVGAQHDETDSAT